MNTPDQMPLEPQYSRQTIDFLTVANEYCHFFENASNYSKEEVALFASRILPLLYIKGSLLPEVEVQFPEATEHYLTEEQWEFMFNELRAIFKKQDQFWSMQHWQFTDEPVKLSVAELLTDVYQDLKDFIILYQSPLSEQKINAIDDVKKLFVSRWGFNCTLALPALHQIIYAESNLSDDFNY